MNSGWVLAGIFCLAVVIADWFLTGVSLDQLARELENYGKALPSDEATEPIVAWRCWELAVANVSYDHIIGEAGYVELQSVHTDAGWPAGEPLVADALHQYDMPDGRRSGVHAFKERKHALSYCRAMLRNGSPVAYGSVSLWGRVIEHTHGYRAERAYPRELILPQELSVVFERSLLAKIIRDKYGCEVSLEPLNA